MAHRFCHYWPRLWHLCTFMFLGSMLLTLLSSCGARTGGGAIAAQCENARLLVDLPALYIDYDTEGIAHIGSVPATTLGALSGVDLTFLNLERRQIQQLMDANLQNIQFTTMANHLLILVNGQAIPSIHWSAEELDYGKTIMADLFPQASQVTAFLPTLGKVGGGAILRFPLQSGAVPITIAPEFTPPVASQADQEAYLRAIGGTPPQVMIHVFYQDDGTWTVDGLNAEQWSKSTPLPWTRLNLERTELETLRAGGIEELTIRSDRNGLRFLVNQRALPE
ncbi:MAG: hypothetical protein KDE31_11945, partial [Caldilineaceae bacterium]|nr:hypothetical protein [Caldilineaceae bacterium]